MNDQHRTNMPPSITSLLRDDAQLVKERREIDKLMVFAEEDYADDENLVRTSDAAVKELKEPNPNHISNRVGTIVKSNTIYGPMYHYDNDKYIGAALAKYGEYSEGEPELWRLFLKSGDNVLDIGANIGVFSRALSSTVGPIGRVYAFEPQPQNYQLLAMNAKRLEGYGHIIATNLALGTDSEKTLWVPDLTAEPQKNYGGMELNSAGNGFEVAVTSLDAWYADNDDAIKVRFAKIDVEGMEAEVLAGAKKFIAENRPVLYVENDRPHQEKTLIRILREYGYKLFEHRPMLYRNNNFNREPITDRHIISINLLCIPNEEYHANNWHTITKDLKMVVPSSPTLRKSEWVGIARLGGIGDNLIAASVLKPLKELGYKIDVLAQRPQHVVFENNPYIDKLSIKETKDFPQNDPVGWQKWFVSRGNEYDRFVNLSHSCEGLTALFTASTQFWWPKEFRQKLCGRNYLELVCDIVGVPYHFGPLFYPTDEEKEQAQITREKIAGGRGGGRPLVGWCITGTRVDKLWHLAPIAIARMIRELNVDVIMFGAPAPHPDFEIATKILEHVRNQNSGEDGLHLALSPAGMDSWPIRRILTMAAHCDVVIGPDTGPMWAVAFEEVPKVMLHSHASVTNIVKHWKNTTSLKPDAKVACWPCHLLHDGIDTCQEMQMREGLKPEPEDNAAACIGSITVEQVLRAVGSVLVTSHGEV